MPYSSRPVRFAPEGKFRAMVSELLVLDRYLVEDFNTLEEAQAFVAQKIVGRRQMSARVYDDKGILVHSA